MQQAMTEQELNQEVLNNPEEPSSEITYGQACQTVKDAILPELKNKTATPEDMVLLAAVWHSD